MSKLSSLAFNLDSSKPLAGRFEVIRCLGVGSLGAVYLVTDSQEFHRPLALKVLMPVNSERERVMNRFGNEVELSKKVKHKNVITILEYINTPDFTGYTMEYMAGGDLHRLIKEKRFPDITNIIRMLLEMCEGLEAIHQQEIVHRDLKPENILLGEMHKVCIADFGVAKKDESPCFTSPGGVVGTLDYQSPEYLEHNISSRKGDIYSLGCIAYELVTGELPFAAESVFKAIELKLNHLPKSPDLLNTQCPQELAHWIMLALERDPEKREGSAAELRKKLVEIQGQYPAQELTPQILYANDKLLRLMEIAKAKKKKDSSGVFSRIARLLSRHSPAVG